MFSTCIEYIYCYLPKTIFISFINVYFKFNWLNEVICFSKTVLHLNVTFLVYAIFYHFSKV